MRGCLRRVGGSRRLAVEDIHDLDPRGFLERKESVKEFVDSEEGYLATSLEVPEEAVAFDQDYLFGLFGAAGMKIRRVVPGEWWRNASAQDVFVAEKSSA